MSREEVDIPRRLSRWELTFLSTVQSALLILHLVIDHLLGQPVEGGGLVLPAEEGNGDDILAANGQLGLAAVSQWAQ